MTHYTCYGARRNMRTMPSAFLWYSCQARATPKGMIQKRRQGSDLTTFYPVAFEGSDQNPGAGTFGFALKFRDDKMSCPGHFIPSSFGTGLYAGGTCGPQINPHDA